MTQAATQRYGPAPFFQKPGWPALSRVKVLRMYVGLGRHEGGVKIMSEEQKESEEEAKRKKKKKSEEPLPFCTTAPSAEHARGSNEDEPCDDSREGE